MKPAVAAQSPHFAISSRIAKIIGNLSNTERVLAGLDLRPHEADSFAARKKEEHV